MNKELIKNYLLAVGYPEKELYFDGVIYLPPLNWVKLSAFDWLVENEDYYYSRMYRRNVDRRLNLKNKLLLESIMKAAIEASND